MNQVQTFKNSDFGELGILVESGKEMFPATECAKALGYTNPRDAIARHCRCVVKRDVPHPQSKDKTILMSYVYESDLLRLIIRSQLECAVKFERWVFEEVLPSIRKHGIYATPDTMAQMISDPDFAIRLLSELKSEREKKAALAEKVEADKPKVAAAEALQTSPDLILIGGLAKLVRQNGVPMGEKRLFQWMRDKGFLMQYGTERNMPTQYSMERGFFEVKERPLMINGEVKITRTTMVTGKGQVYFLDRFTCSKAAG